MINPDLIQQAVKQTEMRATPINPAAPANAADTQKFNAAMAESPKPSAEVQATQAVPSPSATAASAQVDPSNPGDTVLGQIHKISDQLAEDNDYVEKVMDNKDGLPVDPVDVLKMQYRLAQMTTDMTVVTSVASDVKKGVTTLMTNQ